MKAEEKLLKHKSEIEELVLFSKRIHFDIETGDLEELVRLWVDDKKSFYSEENKMVLIALLKAGKSVKMKGGIRQGAGRKPCPDKKVQVPIYVNQSIIDKLGRDKIRDLCDQALRREAEKNTDKSGKDE